MGADVQEQRGDSWDIHFDLLCMLNVLQIISLSPVQLVKNILTFNPIHRMVPTSSCARGDNSRSTDSVRSVREPGDKTERPEKTLTEMFLPSRDAKPTSREACTGSPIKMLEGADLGTKRTRPISLLAQNSPEAFVGGGPTLECRRSHGE